MQCGSPDDCRCLGDPERQAPRRGWPSGGAAIGSRAAGLAGDPWLCGPPACGLVLRTAITPPAWRGACSPWRLLCGKSNWWRISAALYEQYTALEICYPTTDMLIP